MDLTQEQSQRLEEFIVGCYHECDTFVDGMFDCYHPCKKCGAENNLDHLDFKDGNVFLRAVKKLQSIPDLQLKFLHIDSDVGMGKLTGWALTKENRRYLGNGFEMLENFYSAVLAYLEGESE